LLSRQRHDLVGGHPDAAGATEPSNDPFPPTFTAWVAAHDPRAIAIDDEIHLGFREQAQALSDLDRDGDLPTLT